MKTVVASDGTGFYTVLSGFTNRVMAVKVCSFGFPYLVNIRSTLSGERLGHVSAEVIFLFVGYS